MKKVHQENFAQQDGVALVVALVLLLMLTILGVSSMSGSVMQERMAGNVNLQTLAFEAASAGVSDSLEYGLNEENWGGNESCVRGGGAWDSPAPWSAFTTLQIPNLSENIVVEYRRRVGCFEPENMPAHWEEEEYKVPVQLLVLSQGRVRRVGEDEPLALREVEVRVENRGGDSQCAIRVEGGVGGINVKGGGPSIDGGEGGCPVSLPSGGGADMMKDEIGDQHIGKYQPDPPGITENEGHEPWNDEVQVAQIVNDLKYAVQAYQVYADDLDAFNADPDSSPYNVGTAENPEFQWDPVLAGFPKFSGDIEACKSTFYPGNIEIGGSGKFPGGHCAIGPTGNEPVERFSDAPVGDPTDPLHITYVAGHVKNPSKDGGSGIMIVEGGNCWNANADFTGFQLVLGGHFEIIGGGNGDTEGSMILTKLDERYGESDVNFESKSESELEAPPYSPASSAFHAPSGIEFRGGGSHQVQFSCGGDGSSVGHHDYIERINQCLGTNIEPNCGPDGFGTRKAIASWREYVDRERWPDE